MDIHRNVVILFLLVLIFVCIKSSTAEKTVPEFNGQSDIVIQPATGALKGETLVRNIIQPQSKVKVILDLKNVQNASFVIFQVHSYIQPLQLSSALPSEAQSIVNGTDIGLFTKLGLGTVNGTVEYFISNHNNITVDLMLIPVFYSSGDPVPGGCNLNFLVNIAPFMALNFDQSFGIVQVEVQAASALTGGDCQPNGLVYEVYEFYTSGITADAYFDAILAVITADKAAEIAFPSSKPSRQPELRRRFACYPKFGSIYVATVRNIKTGKSSAYVPISNFNCLGEKNDTCEYLSFTVAILWLVSIAAVLYVFAEIKYVTGKDATYFTRLLFLTLCIIVISPALPPSLAWMPLSYLSMGLVILAFSTQNGSFLVRSFRFIVDFFYAAVPAFIIFGLSVPAISYFLFNYQNQFIIVLLFLALFLLFFCMYHLSPGYGAQTLDPHCGNFFLTILLSYAANGVLLYNFSDVARIVQFEYSDVMFYPPGTLADQILLPLFIVLTIIYLPVRRMLREAYLSGEYQPINDNSSEASGRYRTV